MLEELASAGGSLRTALANYLGACTSLRKCVLRGNLSRNVVENAAAQILQEMDRLEEYDSQMKAAKLALNIAHNNTRDISPISALPSDVLSQILHLVPNSELCTSHRLAQVCSGWRDIVLSSRSLWTQIGYHPAGDLERLPKIFDHAQTHVARSGQLPLHMNLSLDGFLEEWYIVPTLSLFPSIGARMQTLELNFMGLNHGQRARAQTDALCSLLRNSTQELFTKLVTRVHDSHVDYLITPSSYGSQVMSLPLDVTMEELDQALGSITVLHTKGAHPHWESTAYHGLVDLRLVSADYNRGVLEKSKLIAILRASPQLRILHLGMFILDSDSAMGVAAPASPVPLLHLETLRVLGHTDFMTHNTIESLVSLLAPSTQPLRVFLESSHMHPKPQLPNAISIKHTRAFFERFNVVELRTENYMVSCELLSFPNYIRVLVFSGSGIRYRDMQILDKGSGVDSSKKLHLDTVYIVHCEFFLEDLLPQLQGTGVQRILVNQSRFYVGGEEVFKSTIHEALSAVCPSVEFEAMVPEYEYMWLSGGLFESTD